MKREFLKGLGLTDELINSIMAQNGDDINAERAKTDAAKASLTELQQKYDTLKAAQPGAEETKKQLDELQAKYDTDTKALQDQLTRRDYADAITAAIAGADLKFSSKGAEAAFRNALAEKALTLKDGKLEGFDDFVKAQKADDPQSFVSGKPAPKFSSPSGVGGKPADADPANVAKAKAMGKEKAEALKNSGDVFAQYSVLKG